MNERSRDGHLVVGAGRPHDTETPDVETASDRYASRFEGLVGEWMLATQTAAIGRLLDHAGGAPLRTLELGGGHGQVAPLLVGRGHDVTLHGSDPVCFRRLDHLRAAGAGRFRTVTSSLWRLPFGDRSFDLVIAVRLLGHTARWRELLAEMTRVSRRYVIVEYARSGIVTVPRAADAIFALKHRIEGTTRPFFSYRERTLLGELDRLSFARVASTAQFAVPMVGHRMARRPGLSAWVEDGLRRIGVGDHFRSPAVVLTERR